MENITIKCRKCRSLLFSEIHLTKESLINSKEFEAQSYRNHAPLWFINVDTCPQWVQSVIEESGYTRGRLLCPNCSAKVGGFDFLAGTGVQTTCTPVHIVKSKVDLANPQQSTPPPRRMPRLSFRHSIPEFGMDTSALSNLPEDSISGTSTCEGGTESSDAGMEQEKAGASADSSSTYSRLTRNHYRSISLPNPLSLIQRADRPTSDETLSYSSEQLESRTSYFLDNLYAIGQAAVDAVEAANIGQTNSEDESDEELPNVLQLDTLDSNQLYTLATIQEPDQATEDAEEGSDMQNSVLPTPTELPVVLSNVDVENYSLMCPICLEPYYHPHKCHPCKHVFCEPCLRRMRRTDMNSPTKCPLCRERIKKCSQDSGLAASVSSAFPDSYQMRHKVEKKQRHKLPPLPGIPIKIDNKYGRNMLATWSAVCGVVLLMMFVFAVFASLVGFVLWYMMEVVLDVVGELFMEISDFFSFSWQALIILYIEGKVPQEINEVLSGSAGRIVSTLSRLVNRTKTFFTDGEVPPPPMTLYINYDQMALNNSSHLLTKVAQANVANYVFLAGLFTYVLYRVARYFQNAQNPRVQ